MSGAWRRVALAVLLVGLLGACEVPEAPTFRAGSTTPTSASSGPPTTSELFALARTAALSSASAHATGTLRRDGERVTVDLEGTASGSDQRLRVTAKGSGTATVLTVGNSTWLRADATYWRTRTTPRLARARADRYVAVTRRRAATVGDWTLRGILAARFSGPDLAPLEGVTDPATPGSVRGREAWVLGAPDGPRLWVATDGSADVLRIAIRSGADAGTLVFDRWNSAQTFDEPAPDELAAR